MIWQFIVFGHNEHEISSASKMAAELDMGFRLKLSWDKDYSPVKDLSILSREMGIKIDDQESLDMERSKYSSMFCSQMWTMPVINWDGKLLGCCKNTWSGYGNVFEKMEVCLKSERYSYAKNLIKGNNKPRKDIPCVNCSVYKNRT
jgi:hypothetical protein